jgi:hypothetical protein
MRVVLDTNVIVSGFLFAQGNPGLIRHAWERGEFEVAVPLPIRAPAEDAFSERPPEMDRHGGFHQVSHLVWLGQ